MKVFSAFGGMECGRQALKELNIEPEKYFSSEIDKHSIKVANSNHNDVIQVGDITKLSGRDFKDVDLFIGGSPCQSFSYAGDRTGFKGKSGLFWQWARLMFEISPKYFLLENVVMKKEWENEITKVLGVEPYRINSRLLTAQNRERLYWTNIPFENKIKDSGVSWNNVSDDGFFAGAMRGRRLDPDTLKRKDHDRSIPIIQYIESRMDDKTNCLSTVGKDNIVSEFKVSRQNAKELNWRYMSRTELEKLQGMPIGYTNAASYNQASKILGNGWTLPVIVELLKHLRMEY